MGLHMHPRFALAVLAAFSATPALADSSCKTFIANLNHSAARWIAAPPAPSELYWERERLAQDNPAPAGEQISVTPVLTATTSTTLQANPTLKLQGAFTKLDHSVPKQKVTLTLKSASSVEVYFMDQSALIHQTIDPACRDDIMMFPITFWNYNNQQAYRELHVLFHAFDAWKQPHP